MTSPKSSACGKYIWTAVIALAVLHQDFWFWGSQTLVFDFLPVGLFYHLLFSIAVAIIWALANRYAWPEHLEEWADEDHSENEGGQR